MPDPPPVPGNSVGHAPQLLVAAQGEPAPDVLAQVFPNTLRFDDGAIVVRTPLVLEQVQLFYHAIKQVEARFHRITQTVAPLADDPNGALTVYLYASRADYETHQPVLFGIDTDNGGIYIERTGTFFTYDRTGEFFPTEELFRHEYVHYLTGRFLIGGMWGEVPIYRDGRLTWFTEGLAEFLTGASSGVGVPARRRQVQRIADDAVRMTVAELLTAADGFRFYRYAEMLIGYWYAHDLATLLRVVELVRAADADGFAAFVDGLAADAALEAAYQAHLDALVASVGSLTDPITAVPPLDALELADPAQVQDIAQPFRLGGGAVCSVAATRANPRFSLHGVLTGTARDDTDVARAWREFDADVEELLGDLRSRPERNFTAVDGRFGRIRFGTTAEGRRYPLVDFCLEGPLAPADVRLAAPQEQVAADFHATRLGASATVEAPDATGTVRVTLWMTTVARPTDVPDGPFAAELADDLDELRNQVYAFRPSYYRRFALDWSAPMAFQDTDDGRRYALRPVAGSVVVPDAVV